MNDDVIKSYEHFASVNDFADALERRPLTTSGEKYCEIKYSLDRVTRYLRHGDAETAAKIKEFQKSLKMQGNGEKKAVEVCKSFCGFMPNVGAVMAGDPNCMYNVKNNIRRDSKVVNLALYFQGWMGIDKDIEFESKSIFLSAVTKLEAQGYQCNIDYLGGGLSQKKEHAVLFSVCIKKATQRLNLSNIAYLLANTKSHLSNCLYIAKHHKYKLFKRKAFISSYGWILNLNQIEELFPNKKAKIITLKDIYGKTEDEIINILTK